MILKTFLFGAVSVFFALVFQKFYLKILGDFEFFKYSFVSFLIFALIEEVIKFLAVYLAVYKSDFFDEPVDAMIYMMTAAMGFAAVENIFAAAGGAEKGILNLDMVFGILVLRFIGATLLHALSSMIIGYYWAKNFTRRILDIKYQMLFGLMAAVLLHTFFNFLILKYSSLAIYPIIFLVIAALFIFWDFEKIKTI